MEVVCWFCGDTSVVVIRSTVFPRNAEFEAGYILASGTHRPRII